MGADGCRSRRRGLELRTSVSALQSIRSHRWLPYPSWWRWCWFGTKGGVASYRRPAASAGSKRDVVRVDGCCCCCCGGGGEGSCRCCDGRSEAEWSRGGVQDRYGYWEDVVLQRSTMGEASLGELFAAAACLLDLSGTCPRRIPLRLLQGSGPTYTLARLPRPSTPVPPKTNLTGP